MKIRIHQLNPEIGLTEDQLREVCTVTCNEIELNSGICDIIFVDDPTLQNMHQKYLDDPSPTDVISFNLGEYEVEGEIYISTDRAKENSDIYHVSIEAEIVRLIIHGLLHLKGYNDIEENDRQEMKKVENRLVGLVQKRI